MVAVDGRRGLGVVGGDVGVDVKVGWEYLGSLRGVEIIMAG